MNGDWRKKIARSLPCSRVRYDVPLRTSTTLRIGGKADCLVELEAEGELEALWAIVVEYAVPFFLLGKGSNVLVPDEGLRGVVVRLGRAFSEIAREGTTVRAGAGCHAR